MFVHFHTLFHSVPFTSSRTHKRECRETKHTGFQSRFGIFICLLNPCSLFSTPASTTWLCWYSFSTLNGNMASDIFFYISQAKKKAKWTLGGNTRSADVSVSAHLRSLSGLCTLKKACWGSSPGPWLQLVDPSWISHHCKHPHSALDMSIVYCIFFQLLSKQVWTCSKFWEVVPLRHFWVPSQTRGSSCFYPSYSPACASICCCSLECALASAGAAFGPFSTLVHRTRPSCSGSGG